MDELHAAMVWIQQHSVLAMLLTFLLILLWAYWPGHKQAFEEFSTIPLRDDP